MRKMSTVITLAGLLSIVIYTFVDAAENCDAKGVLFYEDIGCRAVHAEGKECPTKYECADLKTNNNSCLFKGRSVSVGSFLSNDLTYSSCNADCFCEESGKFTCSAFDCPEWLSEPIVPNCYHIYQPGSCCSVGEMCPSADVDVDECKIDGKIYLEGQEFQPENTCLSCVCPKNFTGKYEPPHCRMIACAIQIHYSEEVRKGCAPVHSRSEGTALCCPDAWLCPGHPVEISKDNDLLTSDLECQFGETSIKLGGKLTSNVEIFGEQVRPVTCTCMMPPLLTCVEM